jgi:LysR family carnitine catabolism transcriptional activator
MQTNISIKQIRAFVAVAQVKSFAEACEIVHLSQPALSIAIKNLEQSIGGQLLARTTRTLSLTPEGLIFLPIAKRLLADFDGAFSDLHELFSLKRGNLALAAMPSFASTHLPQHIMAFRQLHQQINIKIHDVIAEDAVSMVRAGKVEFALSFAPDDSEDLCFEPLFSDQLVATFPANHPLSQKKPLSWKSLAEYPFITLQRPSSIRHLMDQTLAEQQIFLDVVFETNQLATVVQMVASGLGVSAVPSLYKEQIKALKLEYRDLVSPTISRHVGIITRRRYPLSQAAEAFIELVRNVYLPK